MRYTSLNRNESGWNWQRDFGSVKGWRHWLVVSTDLNWSLLVLASTGAVVARYDRPKPTRKAKVAK